MATADASIYLQKLWSVRFLGKCRAQKGDFTLQGDFLGYGKLKKGYYTEG